MRAVLASLVGWLLVACSSAAGTADSEACNRGDECSSGVCGGEGRCVAPVGGAGGEAGGGGEGGGEVGGEAGAGGSGAGGGAAGGSAAGTTGQGGSKVCSPNADGVITREETPILVGASQKMRMAQNAPVDTAGKGTDPASRAWDFTADLAGDHGVLLETQSIEGAWYASKFPGATYAARLSDTEDLLGVFEANDSALLLRGVVSPSDGLTRTELSYTPPVTILAFPMKLGSSWSTQATVAGVLNGVGSTYFETYQSKVDAAGSLKVPYGTFPVLRVNVLLTRVLGALTTTRRTFAFATECFGTVARVISKDNELTTEFSTAAEVSRLSP